MGIIYPDNENRATRVTQLLTFISTIQNELIQSVERNEKQTGALTDQFNQTLTNLGFQNLKELEARVLATLTEEERKRYQEQNDAIKDFDETVTKIQEISLLIGFVSGVVAGVSKPIIVILDTGALAAGLTLFSRGFRALLRGETVGAAMMGGALRTFRALAKGGEVSAGASKLIRGIRTAGAVLTILGVVLDGILLIVQAIVGAKQKEALREYVIILPHFLGNGSTDKEENSAINELVARRFMAKQVELQAFATEGVTGLMLGYLVTFNVLVPPGAEPSEDQKKVLDALTTNIVDTLTASLAAITDDLVWADCKDLDVGLGSDVAWTDEDPDLTWVLEWIKNQPPLVPEDQTAFEIVETEDQRAVHSNVTLEAIPPTLGDTLRTDIGVSTALDVYLKQLSYVKV